MDKEERIVVVRWWSGEQFVRRRERRWWYGVVVSHVDGVHVVGMWRYRRALNWFGSRMEEVEDDGDWAGTVAVVYRRRRKKKKVVVVVEGLIVGFVFFECSEFEDECFYGLQRVKIKQRRWNMITNLSLLISTTIGAFSNI